MERLLAVDAGNPEVRVMMTRIRQAESSRANAAEQQAFLRQRAAARLKHRLGRLVLLVVAAAAAFAIYQEWPRIVPFVMRLIDQWTGHQ